MNERAFTRGLARFFAGGRVPLGIGDDAAVVPHRGRAAVLCCDPVIAGVHFEPGERLDLVGRKAVNRNLADLAAMGAEPDWLLLSLVLPRGLSAARRGQLLRGVRSAARAAHCQVVGGDVAVHDGPLVVTVSAVGHVQRRVLRRDGARVGDHLFVSGALGGSRQGAHLRFVPPLACGRFLAGQRRTGGCLDVSDGLLLDLDTMLRASGGLGAELDATAIPCSRGALRAAAGDRAAALRAALGDGEDHVLLFSWRGAELPAGAPVAERHRLPIGRVTARRGMLLCWPDGRRQRLRPEGFQHGI